MRYEIDYKDYYFKFDELAESIFWETEDYEDAFRYLMMYAKNKKRRIRALRLLGYIMFEKGESEDYIYTIITSLYDEWIRS